MRAIWMSTSASLIGESDSKVEASIVEAAFQDWLCATDKSAAMTKIPLPLAAALVPVIIASMPKPVPMLKRRKTHTQSLSHG